MALTISFVLASLVVALLHHHHLSLSVVDAATSSGFSLRVAPASPGVFPDNDDVVMQPAALRPHVSSHAGPMYTVVATVGTGHGARTYTLKLAMSTTTWLQCTPVVGTPFPQAPPPFNPSASPSLRAVPPSSPLCSDATRPAASKCEFHVEHPDGAVAVGYLVRDTFSFPSGGGSSSEQVPMVFGCAHHTTNFHSAGVVAGVLSLGNRDSSLVAEAARRGAHRFSYCLFATSHNRHGFLRFGADVPATDRMRRTAMIVHRSGPDRGLYFVDLAGVSVAGQRLAVSRAVFDESGTVLDVGAANMVLAHAAFAAVERAVGDHVRRVGLGAVVSYSGYRLCVQGATAAVWNHLPAVTLHFGELHVDMELRPRQMFVEVGQHVCLAVVPGHRTVIGGRQMQDYRFTFDPSLLAIYFAPEQCHLDSMAA